MWNMIKNALIGAKDTLGIEIPGLPIDLGGVGESATTAVQGVVDSAASGLGDATTAAGEAISGLASGEVAPK
jgi:hypothetical protein